MGSDHTIPGYYFTRRDCEVTLEPLHPELALLRVVCACGWKGAAASGVVVMPGVVRCPHCGVRFDFGTAVPIVIAPPPGRAGLFRRRRMA